MSVRMTSNEPVIKLRGHTLLCLQGFRGEGYSAAFVENLGTIHGDLARNPRRLVEVIDHPDAVCGACPHHAHDGCNLKGDSFEAEMRAQDQVVLTRLGFEAGMRVRWEEILERIRDRVRGMDLVGICGQCRWLPLGYCAEGIESLRAGSAASPISSHGPLAGWVPSSSLKRPPSSKA
jgi:hypothetical protein